MLIDAHCHVWRIGKNDHEWPTPDLSAIHRDFGLDDLRAAGGPDGVVLVQSQPSERDTAWLLELAAADPLALGVVGWTDLAAPDAPAKVLALARDPKLKGLRPMLQDLASDWILDPALGPAIAAMVEAGLAFDALVRPRHLSSLLAFVRRWPELRVVIDHGGKPAIGEGRLDPWRGDIAALAAEQGVHCKLSGLLTEAGEAATIEAVAPYVAHLLDVFGPERLMWGSDWPVLNLAGDYASWREMGEAWVPPAGRAALFGETARRFYRL
ncbi:amidohydrolase family protein [Caulobacter endophyticus]|uniref:amidohydrolase family protein n=1 Tax=Caulobacter endophyticus TaxID=2172652 RepID=UPI0024104B1C|nr:amidohydrolase family protein [Caulobacter endophyticus]MDG2531050.1 amidohydrolase family protein [Caulobacter endophyticus]